MENKRFISDSHAMDTITDLFKLNEDWTDISLIDIEDIIKATGRNTDIYLVCSECGDCYDETDYTEVFEKSDGELICEKCNRTEIIEY